MKEFLAAVSGKQLFSTGITAALFLIIFLPTHSLLAASIDSKVGTTGFSFLKIGVGSRATAMGGASAALADDPSAIYYNPAGTAILPGRQFTAGYLNYLLDIQSGYIGVTLPASSLKLPDGKIGFFVDYLNYGTFARTDAEGRSIGEFSGGDFLLGVNYSIRMKNGLSTGINLKFMSERADGYGAQAVAADLGLMMNFKDNRTIAGLSVANLGAVTSGYSSHKDKLPLAVRGGVSHRVQGLPVVVALDGVLPNDNKPYLNVGTEVEQFKPLFLRLGYTTFGENFKTGAKNSALGGFSFGFGLDAKIQAHQYHISYAFMPYLDLGSSHRVTITGDF